MKRTMTKLIGAICLVAIWTLPTGAADVAKIGVIDFQRFLMESDIGQQAQAKIESQGTKMEEDLAEKGNKIEVLKNMMERDAMVMSEAKREDKMREYRIKINDLKALQKKYRSSFQKLEQRLITTIQEKAMELAEKLGKEEGYLLLIEKNAAIYYPSAIDATDQLIKLANSKDLSLEETEKEVEDYMQEQDAQDYLQEQDAQAN